MVSSKKRRRLVFCPNRIYNFEQWQILLTVMELYKLYHIELTVVHVQSVLQEIYEFMKYYELDGILEFRQYMGEHIRLE
jgi:hypothetical protein